MAFGLVRPKRFLDRCFRQGRHNLVCRSVRMQAIFGEFALEQAFVVDHGGEPSPHKPPCPTLPLCKPYMPS